MRLWALNKVDMSLFQSLFCFVCFLFCIFVILVFEYDGGYPGNDSCTSRCQSASCPVLSRWDQPLGSSSVSRSEAGSGSRSKLHLPEPNQNRSASSDTAGTDQCWRASLRTIGELDGMGCSGPLQSCILASLNAGLCTALITNSDLGDVKFCFFYCQIGRVRSCMNPVAS